MKPDAPPTIHSFIIRFVVEETPTAEEIEPVYHGAIRHIQSTEELHFHQWQEAVQFMRRFVPLRETDGNKSQHP
jgi:hypothetical protein